jgi:hypothetical protein
LISRTVHKPKWKVGRPSPWLMVSKLPWVDADINKTQ